MSRFNLFEYLSENEFNKEYIERFEGGIVERCVYNRHTGKVIFHISISDALSMEVYKALCEFFEEILESEVKIYVSAKQWNLSQDQIEEYLKLSCAMNKEALPYYDSLQIEGNKLIFSFDSSIAASGADACLNRCKETLKMFGVDAEFDSEVKELPLFESLDVVAPKVQEAAPLEKRKPAYRKLKIEDYPVLKIQDIEEPMENIAIQGKIFDQEVKVIRKTNREIRMLYIMDEDDSIIMKRFENNRCTKEELDEIKVGDTVKAFGSAMLDSFSNEMVFMPNEVIKVDAKEAKAKDEAPIKRIELHMHSNMSEMDGVCEATDMVAYAFELGHRAVAITDHMVVQTFPKVHNSLAKLHKKDPDRNFKVLYGVEMNMVDSDLTIVRNATDESLNDATYVVYDLETTGLSCRYDHIIEFGAVKMQHHAEIGRLQMFIKPPVEIDSFIADKTNITNETVKDAEPIEKAIDKILDFIGDSVLVAHNATFDFSFLNETLRKLGRNELKNPVIDTLDLARAVLKDRKTYKLGAIARSYHITYDEEVAHRADYDAEVLNNVFTCMIRDCKNMGAKTVADLQNLQDDEAFKKVYKHHTTLLCRNQQGLKDLFNLVSLSHTKYLSVLGKATKAAGEDVAAEPRILRSSIAANRENLLVGTSCFNGEIFELASNRSQETLEEAMKFYDYVEIQPLECYRPLIEQHSVATLERLKEILRNIVETAKKMGKIVVATGDVHYLTNEQKIYRDIYIQAQGIGGVRHPLYIYNAERRRKTKSPNQRFLTTDEMLDAFVWLGRDLAYEMVVTNTNKIADMTEVVIPVHDRLYPPSIEGANEKLEEICYKTAHEVYGEVLPEIVDARLKRELKSIIGNGYAVNYYIAHLLVKKSNEDGYLVGSRGSVGSSFVATMSGITEVNPLAPHYICPHCQYSEFLTNGEVQSGFDLPDKKCPVCGSIMRGDGQDIPFETFLGFEGDKVPDIDLNFSGEYQPTAHNFTKTVFGDDHVFRAGTIGTVALKTAFGYVSGYAEEKGLTNMRQAQRLRLAKGCEGVKRTTGQHPGGIIVIPSDMDVHDFTPVNYPANNPNSDWLTTHFEFHDIHDNVLKFDILGHVDPTAMRMFQNISGIDPTTIPMNDPQTMSIFHSCDALKIDSRDYNEITGAVGLPEFGTKFGRGILELTKPTTFSDLVRISGLSHGTDVWLNNGKELVESGLTLQDIIGCRDDIMTYLLHHDLNPKDAFFIMESVRKGKGLKEEWIPMMKEHNVPDWYIESCKKIKYMFPKAHAVAYVIMAIRTAWFKVHHPHWYYCEFFSLRCDAYEIDTMIKGKQAIKDRMDEIASKMNNPETKNSVSKKEIDLYATLENALEMVCRGYRFGKIDLNLSKATEFSVQPDDLKTIIPPFTAIDGLGANVAKTVVEAREQMPFLSKQDLASRTQLSQTLIKKLEILGSLEGLQEENQMSLF